MKIRTAKRSVLFACLLLVLFSGNLVAQQKSVSGKLTDVNGTAVEGTTISIARTNATGEIASESTNGQGTVVFTEQQLTQPGFYFLLAKDGTKKTKVKTKYFLRTDGKTRVNVTL